MSGFSSELIDYLEGRITFEEFDRRRDERKAEVRQTDRVQQDRTRTLHVRGAR